MVNLSYNHLSGEDIEDKELIYPIPLHFFKRNVQDAGRIF